MKPIPIAKISVGPEEERALCETLASGWLVQGARVAEFENLFRTFVNADFALATSSCTTALHAAVVALGLKPGDEVIVPAFTWVATANAVEYTGAKPVFCDIDLSTFNLDTSYLRSLVTPRTVGVIPVHLFGLSAPMTEILGFAQEAGLWVVEDAACALGTFYQGAHVGGFAEFGCFSFHPRKSITTGEGGMVVTSSQSLADRVGALRSHGGTASSPQTAESLGALAMPEFPYLGFNYRMTDLQGALGCVQIGRVSEILSARAAVAEGYREALAEIDWLRLPSTPAGDTHSYQSYVCLVTPVEPTTDRRGQCAKLRDRLMLGLQTRGISTRQGTHAPPLTAYYREKYQYETGDFPMAALAESCSLALPLYAGMTSDEVQRVVDALVEVHQGV